MRSRISKNKIGLITNQLNLSVYLLSEGLGMRLPSVKLFLSMKELKTPLPYNPDLALIRDKPWELGCSQSLFCHVISVCLNVINFRELLIFYYFVENN